MVEIIGTFIRAEDGAEFDVVPKGAMEALNVEEPGVIIDAGPPDPQDYSFDFPLLYRRGGYYRFECKTNARNFFWFDYTGGRKGLRASVHSTVFLFRDPDGDGPGVAPVRLSYIGPNGAVYARSVAGRIEMPTGVAPGRCALLIEVAHSNSVQDQVITLYPN